MAEYLSPEEINAYQTRKNSLDSQYGVQSSRNTYQKGINTQDYGLGRTRMTTDWNNKFNGFGAGMAHRGMSNSGVYQQGLSDYMTGRQNAFSDWDRQYQRKQGDVDFQQAQMDETRMAGHAQVDSEMAARRAALASVLREVL